jgi:TPR repeat protein
MAYADVALTLADLKPEASHDDLFQMGLSFATGQGAPVDFISAHKWFNLAALRGSEEAKSRRRELSDIMSASEIAAAQRAAREWLSRAH